MSTRRAVATGDWTPRRRAETMSRLAARGRRSLPAVRGAASAFTGPVRRRRAGRAPTSVDGRAVRLHDQRRERRLPEAHGPRGRRGRWFGREDDGAAFRPVRDQRAHGQRGLRREDPLGQASSAQERGRASGKPGRRCAWSASSATSARTASSGSRAATSSTGSRLRARAMAPPRIIVVQRAPGDAGRVRGDA